MKYIFFADVHSNIFALRQAIELINLEEVDRLICLGDIVGYGPDPRICIDKIKELKAVFIAGNHDWAVADRIDTRYFNPVASFAVDWTRERISDEQKDFLFNLPLIYEENDWIAVHGTLDNPEGFYYLLNITAAKRTFQTMEEKSICFVAHSHIPGVFVQAKDGEIQLLEAEDIKLDDRFKYIINVGSIGQPRDRNPKGCMCVFDSDERTICFNRFAYPVEEAKQRIIDEGLPEILGVRLLLGQ